MTREEVVEIMNYSKEHKVTYKSRLEELNIPVWRFYDNIKEPTIKVSSFVKSYFVFNQSHREVFIRP